MSGEHLCEVGYLNLKSSLIGSKWEPLLLNGGCSPKKDTNFQPAHISMVSHHLKSGLSQLLDHYTPSDWSRVLVKPRTWTSQNRRQERTFFQTHFPPKKTFSLHIQALDTKLLLCEEFGVNKVLRVTGSIRPFLIYAVNKFHQHDCPHLFDLTWKIFSRLIKDIHIGYSSRRIDIKVLLK